MNINDYLIDPTGIDFKTMLCGWSEILPQTFTVWLVNRFGDAFIIVDDGSVYLLDVVGGTFECVAEQWVQFAELMEVPLNANNWLMIPLVDSCTAAGMSLEPGQCYGFIIPPLLSGALAPHNVTPVSLTRNYAFLADLWMQTRDIPDGTEILIVMGPQPGRVSLR